MTEKKELKVLSNGEYKFAETENNSQFNFYRNDGEVLGDVGRLPMEVFQDYIFNKMLSGELTTAVATNIKFEMSDDGRCLRMTTLGYGSKEPVEQTGVIKRLVRSLFGRNKKKFRIYIVNNILF